MDFQKALDRESAKLALGVRAIALEIVEQVFAADSKPQKVKKPLRRRKPKLQAPRKLKPNPPKPEKSEAYIVVGDLWKRRDGDGPRHVMAVDDTHVTVDSPKYHDGTRVKLSEFVKRYKRIG